MTPLFFIAIVVLVLGFMWSALRSGHNVCLRWKWLGWSIDLKAY